MGSTTDGTVIFLGAGASVAEGASSQATLFRDYFAERKRNHEPIDPHLVRYFKQFWSIDLDHDAPDKTVYPTFEEALGMLEMARDRGEAFHGFYHTPNSNGIGHTIEDLVLLIAEILHRRLQGNVHHTALVRGLLRAGLARQTTFVSLNYDILVDNALTAVHPDIDLDYGLDFVNFRNSNDWVEPRPDMAVGLYKIHGSLNWLYCPVCKEIRLTPKVKGVLTLIPSDRNRRVNCVLCGGHYSYVLVPPTVFKVMTNPHLVRVWEKCERALRQASRVIFCGYSLPDADIHIKYLLKRAQMNRKSAGEFRVTVINHHKTKTDSENITEEQRYVRLFGRGAVKYTNVSFSEFAADSERFVRGP